MSSVETRESKNKTVAKTSCAEQRSFQERGALLGKPALLIGCLLDWWAVLSFTIVHEDPRASVLVGRPHRVDVGAVGGLIRVLARSPGRPRVGSGLFLTPGALTILPLEVATAPDAGADPDTSNRDDENRDHDDPLPMVRDPDHVS